MHYSCVLHEKLPQAVVNVTGDDFSRVFLLTDTNTYRYCLPLLQEIPLYQQNICIIEPGEQHKNINTLDKIYTFLLERQANRDSFLINLGGGTVTDTGGFAASTFKRGIRFLNIPTTLMAMIDAAHGGKNGINIAGIKNQAGTFSFPEEVIVCPAFLKTLDSANLLSGYAEMIKHALLDTSMHLDQVLKLHVCDLQQNLTVEILELSLQVKQRFVEADVYEKNIRAALNLGHTAGHAIEAWSMGSSNPLSHGAAVAFGLLVALYLSEKLQGFSTHETEKVKKVIHQWFGRLELKPGDITELFDLMRHDKKSRAGEIRFTLLAGIGNPVTGVPVADHLIHEAFYHCYEIKI